MIAHTGTGPPKKRSDPFSLVAGTGPGSKLRIAIGYHGAGAKQALFTAWQLEAARLALEYLRTAREIHRLAFERHMGGMLAPLWLSSIPGQSAARVRHLIASAIYARRLELRKGKA
jgi:hypothetical protein